MENTSETKIPLKDIYYFRQRFKNRVLEELVRYFTYLADSEGLTRREVAARLDKDPSQITRWLSGPNNLTLETVSDLLLAMRAEPRSLEIRSLVDHMGNNSGAK